MDTFERAHERWTELFFFNVSWTGLLFTLAGLDFFLKNTIKTHPVQDTTGQKKLIETKMIEHVKNMLLFLLSIFKIMYIYSKNITRTKNDNNIKKTKQCLLT